ncbi:MAG: hypothetical protein Q3988_04030 [Gemella sp.]|nr:hypothetical protein [Gemella sp.]
MKDVIISLVVMLLAITALYFLGAFLKTDIETTKLLVGMVIGAGITRIYYKGKK